MKGTRILRYIGNRPKPEENPFSLDEYLRDTSLPFLLLGENTEELLKRLDNKVPDPMFSDFVKRGDPCSQVVARRQWQGDVRDLL